MHLSEMTCYKIHTLTLHQKPLIDLIHYNKQNYFIPFENLKQNTAVHNAEFFTNYCLVFYHTTFWGWNESDGKYKNSNFKSFTNNCWFCCQRAFFCKKVTNWLAKWGKFWLVFWKNPKFLQKKLVNGGGPIANFVIF